MSSKRLTASLATPLKIALSAVSLALCLAVGFVPSAQAVTRATYESDAIKTTNAERTKRKLVALKANACLDGYAEAWAKASVKRQYLQHSNLGVILRACKLRGVNENIAYGFKSGAALTQGWMNSSGHRANILRSSNRLIGLAAFQDSKGRWWSAQIMGNY